MAAVRGDPTQDLDCVIPAYFSLARPRSDDSFSPSNVDALGIRQKDIYGQDIGMNSESLKKDRCTSYIPAIDPCSGRVRALNLYLSMAAKPAKTVVLDNDKGISCLLVRGCGQQQYPLIASLDASARGNLPTLLGPHARLAEEAGVFYRPGSHKFALATGGAFFFQPGSDPLTGMPLNGDSDVVLEAEGNCRQSDEADEPHGNGRKRKAEDERDV